jgi:hypothetical protein
VNFLRKLRSLRPVGRRILLQAACALPLVALALRLFGFARVYAALGRWTGHARPPADRRAWVEGTRHLIRYLAEQGPYRGNCLSQSLVLWWLLRRRGIEADLRFGVRTEEGQLHAHAWVEYQGQPLNAPGQVQKYVPFDQAILPDGVRFP